MRKDINHITKAYSVTYCGKFCVLSLFIPMIIIISGLNPSTKAELINSQISDVNDISVFEQNISKIIKDNRGNDVIGG
jgi:hypothetical protein